ncbi:Growth arrest and DNA damage-inducible protein GADD45 beta [Mizuhopecten yessoensis]|uniref:Growth arrest and DNA damage-inducible protein GADD45 beta n=1 Tax=Mizuhopecten yessoensis TaxID=6573 RepID=A0A210QJA8_MIZYE|nr:Growth arrest and DNA damage-inducible protein GADD45 beta [Mizuhopecten yessoensis]
MTLPDEYPEDSGALSKQVLHEVSRSLEKLLQDAQLEHRLTTGVYNCAEILQRCPDQVMLCILPDSGPGHDVTIDIEHTLIEAYCWENDVRVLKVGNAHVLNKVFNNDVSLREMKKVSRQQSQGVDFSCLLVKVSLIHVYMSLHYFTTSKLMHSLLSNCQKHISFVLISIQMKLCH